MLRQLLFFSAIFLPIMKAQQQCFVIFGDSLSDTGRLLDYTSKGIIANAKTMEAPRRDVYWNGRFSNSPGNWVDWITSQGKGSVKVWNYAFGGATVCNFPNTFFQASIPSVTEQVQMYIHDLATNPSFAAEVRACKERVVVMWGGHNDLAAAFKQGQVNLTTKMNSALVSWSTCMADAAVRLVKEAGEKNIMLGTLAPLQHAPLIKQKAKAAAKLMSAAVAAMNKLLTQKFRLMRINNIAVKDLRVEVWPVTKQLAKWIDGYRKFGFAFGSAQSCIQMTPAGESLEGDPPVSVCSNPDDYVFFDGVHPSSKAHKLVAKSLSDALLKAKMIKKALIMV